tara:strand:+ start:30 stop:635 length:606 start_codon:yes stop_codon:yes gene_type:complete
MAIATYDDLKNSIASWLNRDDLTPVIPDFISLAEAQIARDIRHWRQEKRVTTSVNEQYENLPIDWLEMTQIQLTSGGRLQSISAAEMQDRKELSQTSGKPKYYRLTSDQIELYPVPDAPYEAAMQYYARIPALTDADSPNWILTNYPDVYLYGSLIHAAPYLLDDNRVSVWASFYSAASQALNQDNENSRVSGPLRMGVPK